MQYWIRCGYNLTEIRFPCFLSLIFSTVDYCMLDISKPGTASTLPSVATLLALSKMQHFNQVCEVRWKHNAAFWNKCFGTTEYLWSMQWTLITTIQTACTTNASAICLLVQMEGNSHRNLWRCSPSPHLWGILHLVYSRIFSMHSPKRKHSFKSINS